MRLKASGTVIRLPQFQRDMNSAQFLEHARTIAEWHQSGEIAGWAIVIWNKDGTYSDSMKVEEFSPVTYTLLPSYVADVVRRRLAEEGWS